MGIDKKRNEKKRLYFLMSIHEKSSIILGGPIHGHCPSQSPNLVTSTTRICSNTM